MRFRCPASFAQPAAGQLPTRVGRPRGRYVSRAHARYFRYSWHQRQLVLFISAAASPQFRQPGTVHRPPGRYREFIRSVRQPPPQPFAARHSLYSPFIFAHTLPFHSRYSSSAPASLHAGYSPQLRIRTPQLIGPGYSLIDTAAITAAGCASSCAAASQAAYCLPRRTIFAAAIRRRCRFRSTAPRRQYHWQRVSHRLFKFSLRCLALAICQHYRLPLRRRRRAAPGVRIPPHSGRAGSISFPVNRFPRRVSSIRVQAFATHSLRARPAHRPPHFAISTAYLQRCSRNSPFALSANCAIGYYSAFRYFATYFAGDLLAATPHLRPHATQRRRIISNFQFIFAATHQARYSIIGVGHRAPGRADLGPPGHRRQHLAGRGARDRSGSSGHRRAPGPGLGSGIAPAARVGPGHRLGITTGRFVGRAGICRHSTWVSGHVRASGRFVAVPASGRPPGTGRASTLHRPPGLPPPASGAPSPAGRQFRTGLGIGRARHPHRPGIGPGHRVSGTGHRRRPGTGHRARPRRQAAPIQRPALRSGRYCAPSRFSLPAPFNATLIQAFPAAAPPFRRRIPRRLPLATGSRQASSIKSAQHRHSGIRANAVRLATFNFHYYSSAARFGYLPAGHSHRVSTGSPE